MNSSRPNTAEAHFSLQLFCQICLWKNLRCDYIGPRNAPLQKESIAVSVAWTNDNYWLVRTVFQRALALVYLIAFLNALNQFRPLLGERGLLPAPAWIKAVPFRASPSLFYLAPKDWAFMAVHG
jgi:hypothetical protein